MRTDRRRLPAEPGLSLIEALVATVLVLGVALLAYALLSFGRRVYVVESDIAAAQSNGRVALTLMMRDLRRSGFSPLGLTLDAIDPGEPSRLRILFDGDADGRVRDVSGAVLASEAADTVTWQLVDADLDDVFELRRGVDLDGNGDYTDDPAETFASILAGVVAIDVDGDGTTEPFFRYSPSVAAVRVVEVAFGVRVRRGDLAGDVFKIIPFQATVTLRNRAPLTASSIGLGG